MYIDENEMYVASRLTTVDNKWNPFTQFSEWYNEDVFVLGYNTCGLQARKLTEYLNKNHLNLEELSDYEYAKIVDSIILDVIYEFPDLYRRVESKDTKIEDLQK